MNIKKQDVIDIQGVYAIGSFDKNGKVFFVASSENHNGSACAIDAENPENVYPFSVGAGGSMGLVNIPESDTIFSIENFFPVFDSQEALVVKTRFTAKNGKISGQRLQKTALPYCHRIAVVTEPDGQYVICGTLCKHKEFVEDWSTAGSVMVSPLSDGILHFSSIKEGIHKHHALSVYRNKAGYDDVYAGGSEGTFKCGMDNGLWKVERILPNPTSEITVGDFDDDGKDEIAIIEGFHGNMVKIFKEENGSYNCVTSLPIQFGHVLWSGRILGNPALIVGERGGNKELSLYHYTKKGLIDKTVIDSGIGPTQIFVKENTLVSSNHEVHKVSMYSFLE
ncbi:MAG: hypothetical protein LKF96_03605 [Treponema sp.]|nr:hypothetical protein [Treponema sp.]